MKIEGARKALRDEQRTARVVRNADLMERLQRIRALLAEVREELNTEPAELLAEPAAAPAPAEAAAPAETAAPAPESPAAEAAPTESKPRRPRRKKEENENKELFAFFEQSLF